MSDPIKKLEQTCEILGKECKELVKEHKELKIDEITFVEKYFDMLDKTPTSEDKTKAIAELEKFMTVQKEVSFRDEPLESEVRSE